MHQPTPGAVSDGLAVNPRLLADLQRPLALVRPNGMPWLRTLLDLGGLPQRLVPLMTSWLGRWGASMQYDDGPPLVHARWVGAGDPTLSDQRPAVRPAPAGPAVFPAATHASTGPVRTAPPAVQARAVAPAAMSPSATRRDERPKVVVRGTLPVVGSAATSPTQARDDASPPRAVVGADEASPDLLLPAGQSPASAATDASAQVGSDSPDRPTAAGRAAEAPPAPAALVHPHDSPLATAGGPVGAAPQPSSAGVDAPEVTTPEATTPEAAPAAWVHPTPSAERAARPGPMPAPRAESEPHRDRAPNAGPGHPAAFAQPAAPGASATLGHPAAPMTPDAAPLVADGASSARPGAGTAATERATAPNPPAAVAAEPIATEGAQSAALSHPTFSAAGVPKRLGQPIRRRGRTRIQRAQPASRADAANIAPTLQHPGWASPEAANRAGVSARSIARPDGAAPDGAAPDGPAPDGAAPDGAAPDGARSVTTPSGPSAAVTGVPTVMGQSTADAPSLSAAPHPVVSPRRVAAAPVDVTPAPTSASPVAPGVVARGPAHPSAPIVTARPAPLDASPPLAADGRGADRAVVRPSPASPSRPAALVHDRPAPATPAGPAGQAHPAVDLRNPQPTLAPVPEPRSIAQARALLGLDRQQTTAEARPAAPAQPAAPRAFSPQEVAQLSKAVEQRIKASLAREAERNRTRF